MVTIILFIVILAILVIVHELGHFIVAKLSGIRVDEFGLGFPPRLFGKKIGGTIYSLNAVPFGGFVKIFGEDVNEESMRGPDSRRSFVNKPKWIQIAVLVAGIAFNILFAWILISAGFMAGLPTSLDAYPDQTITDAHVVVTSVSPQSPAEEAGLKVGDRLTSLRSQSEAITGSSLTIDAVQNFVSAHPHQEITIDYARGQSALTAKVIPQDGIVEGKPAIGISMDNIGVLRLSFFPALYQGALLTGSLVSVVASSLYHFIVTAITGKAHLADVTGPVGIAGMVGDASRLGFIYLLSFTALISINLAVVNLIPFPALDGGRILFVLIEAIKGKPIKPNVANVVNAAGFALLILLMLVVTYHDITKLFIR